MNVKIANSAAELQHIAKVMLQLRPHFTAEALIEQITNQQKQGYQIAYVEQDHQILSVAGFVIAQKLAWGKHIYIDDWVSSAAHRSQGAGAYLMKWFKQFAMQQGCAQIHLDSGVQRFGAHKFYLREGFKIASHHFSMALDE